MLTINGDAGDVVTALDAIGAEMGGTGPYDWPASRLNDGGRERNRRLMALALTLCSAALAN